MGSDGMEVKAIRSNGTKLIAISEAFGLDENMSGYQYYESLHILEQRVKEAKKKKAR